MEDFLCGVLLDYLFQFQLDTITSKFLIGAEKMDMHFKESPIEKIFDMFSVVGIWNSNFLGSDTQGIIPYTEYQSTAKLFTAVYDGK